jgi:hypothetical protein
MRLYDHQYPSVTTILGVFNRYEGIGRNTLRLAAERGRQVHKVTALRNQGITWTPPDVNLAVIRPYLEQYDICKRHHIKNYMLIEQPLVNRKLGYGGTADRVGFLLGDANGLPPALIDLKTTADLDPLMAIQLAAYQELLEANKIRVRRDAYIIHLTRTRYEFVNVWDVFDTAPEQALQGWHYARWLYYFTLKGKGSTA